MNKTRLIILPILAIFFALIFGWSTISGQETDKITQQILEIEALPSGSEFQMTISDEDATSAAQSYLIKYMNQIQETIRQMIGTKLDLSKPKVEFGEDELAFSIKGGKGFMKVNISLRADAVWNGSTLQVDVKSIDVPIVSVDPATANSYIQGPINNFVELIKQYYDIRSFKLSEGSCIIDASKK